MHSANSSDPDRAGGYVKSAVGSRGDSLARQKHPYVRFDAGRFRPTPAPADGEEASPASPIVPELPNVPDEGFDSWDDQLDWCAAIGDTRLCFVVDSQGFVLNHHGDWDYDDIEDVASQLTVTMSRADESEVVGRSRVIAIEYEAVWITGIRFQSDGVDELTLVMVSEAPLPPPHVTGISAVVRQSLAQL